MGDEAYSVLAQTPDAELNGSPHAFFVPALSLRQALKGRSFDLSEDLPEHLVMCLVLSGSSQKRLANLFLSELDHLFGERCLSFDNSILEGLDVSYRDAASALWATAISHPKHYPLTCKNCGRTVLSTTQGAGREFCSDVCRAAYNKATRQLER